MYKHYTYYAAKELDFEALAHIIANIEKSATDTEIVDIILLFTGEVLASRNCFGLWEINI
jgi:hypothetical protein